MHIRMHLDPTRDVDPLADVRIPWHWQPAFSTPAGLAAFGRTVDFLEASPGLHRQRQWITEHVGLRETRACFAGWTALLAGAVPIRAGVAPHGGYRELYSVSYGGRVRDVADVATEILELRSRGFANVIFGGCMTLADIKRCMRLAEASTLPDFVPEHWTMDGHPAPKADTLAQLALSRS